MIYKSFFVKLETLSSTEHKKLTFKLFKLQSHGFDNDNEIRFALNVTSENYMVVIKVMKDSRETIKYESKTIYKFVSV